MKQLLLFLSLITVVNARAELFAGLGQARRFETATNGQESLDRKYWSVVAGYRIPRWSFSSELNASSDLTGTGNVTVQRNRYEALGWLGYHVVENLDLKTAVMGAVGGYQDRTQTQIAGTNYSNESAFTALLGLGLGMWFRIYDQWAINLEMRAIVAPEESMTPNLDIVFVRLGYPFSSVNK